MAASHCSSRRILISIAMGLSLLLPAIAKANPALQFVSVSPCRVADTRNPVGPYGGPSITGGAWREFLIPASICNIPGNAAAYSLNVTVVPHGPLGFLTIWPSGQSQPLASTLNSFDGRVKANAVVVAAGADTGVNVYVSDTADVVLDINGYFTPGGALAFYTLAPCRVLDTRNPDGPLGGPNLSAGQPRSFPVLTSSCNIPTAAQAYSLNVTALPRAPLGFLSVWPDQQAWPGVSTLNAPGVLAVANGAIVPVGPGGAIQALASSDSDMIIDINGYFAPLGSGGLSLYPLLINQQPNSCRVLDTRNGQGNFAGELTVDVVGSACSVPSAAQAFVLNATVVPPGPLGFLTLWPDSKAQPLVSTLNSYDGAVTSNMAIVPTVNGKIDAFASDLTALILDISGYFAPQTAGGISAPTYFLVGNWTGTATVVDGTGSTTYNIAASITQTTTSFSATLVVTIDSIPVIYAVAGQINGNSISFVTSSSDSQGIDNSASGTVSPNGLQVSGGSLLDTSSGTMTWDGANSLSGSVRVEDEGSYDTWNSTIITDGQHITGSATDSTGDSATWSLTRQ